MAQSKTFSLRSLFVWCSVAAALLAVVGLGFRGIEWASGASWALLGGLITMFCLALLYWVAHWLAIVFDYVAPPAKRLPGHPPPGMQPPSDSTNDKPPVPIGSSPELQ